MSWIENSFRFRGKSCAFGRTEDGPGIRLCNSYWNSQVSVYQLWTGRPCAMTHRPLWNQRAWLLRQKGINYTSMHKYSKYVKITKLPKPGSLEWLKWQDLPAGLPPCLPPRLSPFLFAIMPPCLPSCLAAFMLSVPLLIYFPCLPPCHCLSRHWSDLVQSSIVISWRQRF